jgi:hypothetical protein
MNSDQDTVSKTLQIVKRIDDSPDLVDVMIAIEDYLDRNDMYAFKNWILGELIDGPWVMPYWIKVGFKWPGDKMPDPTGAERLLQHGTKIGYKKTNQNVSQPVEEPGDYKTGTHKPKIKAEPVWIVEMLIPRRFVEDIDDEIMDLYDERVDDMNITAKAEGEGTTEDNATTNGSGEADDLGAGLGNGVDLNAPQ